MFEDIRKNKFKTMSITFLVTLFVMLFVYFIARYTGFGTYAVPLALLMSLGSSFFSYFFSDKIVLKFSGARPADPETERKLTNIMEGLCVSAGMPMPKLYVVDDDAPNAFATGRNYKNAVVCVTTGLLDRLDYYELEGVLAHELAHIKNYDILLSTVVAVMLGMVVILADIFTRASFFGFGVRNDDEDSGSSSSGIFMVIGILFALLAPIASQLMKMALSRNREYLADATAVEFTRNPQGLADALRKISSSHMSVRRASRATENMYISNPFSAEDAMELFSTHPPIEKRINAILNIK